jgi:hypothetical protein
VKPGSVVYFRRCRPNSSRKSEEHTFKGNGVGLLLGDIPSFAPDVNGFALLKAMGTLGFISFDDVKAFLGDSAMSVCIKQFEEKYWEEELGAKNGETENV